MIVTGEWRFVTWWVVRGVAKNFLVPRAVPTTVWAASEGSGSGEAERLCPRDLGTPMALSSDYIHVVDFSFWTNLSLEVQALSSLPGYLRHLRQTYPAYSNLAPASHLRNHFPVCSPGTGEVFLTSSFHVSHPIFQQIPPVTQDHLPFLHCHTLSPAFSHLRKASFLLSYPVHSILENSSNQSELLKRREVTPLT